MILLDTHALVYELIRQSKLLQTIWSLPVLNASRSNSQKVVPLHK